MKKIAVILVLASASLWACKPGNATQAAEQEAIEAEVQQLDSLSNELESIESELDAKADELEEALNHIETFEE
ncbi:MAG: hypothetical protein KTR30_30990 [Saprospiraceae bacterium]|nr:hypothetical protein [Saprospiraceae bacterium]